MVEGDIGVIGVKAEDTQRTERGGDLSLESITEEREGNGRYGSCSDDFD